jgi:hypothetical protein
MVVDAVLERNPEVSFKNAVDMDKVKNAYCFFFSGLLVTAEKTRFSSVNFI